MAIKNVQSPVARRVWALVRAQHGVVSRAQLLAAGLGSNAVKRRTTSGRLHPLWRGVYAVGRPEVGRHGWWIAAVLAAGPEALLSHDTGVELWGVEPARGAGASAHGGLAPVSRPIHVSVPYRTRCCRPGIVAHRRDALGPDERARREGIPVTAVSTTLIDVAAHWPGERLEAAVSEADRRDLVDPETLRDALEAVAPRPGTARLRRLLDRQTFRLTDSELERRFLALVGEAGLPLPQTGTRPNGFTVDFHWPDLGLIVETDGLRYHRTAAQQARDRRRDQAHAAAGLTALRFTNAQIRVEQAHVIGVLRQVARRLATARATPPRSG